MAAERRKLFDEWYKATKEKNETYNFKEELISYYKLQQIIHTDTDFIEHGNNIGEKRIHTPHGQKIADGYCDATSPATVYEFFGCWYHGCPKCYPNRKENHPRHNNRTMEQIYEQTQTKLQLLQGLSYQIKTMWECEMEKMKENEIECNFLAGTLEIVDRLIPAMPFTEEELKQ